MSILSDYLNNRNINKTNKKFRKFLIELQEIVSCDKINWKEKYHLAFNLYDDKIEPELGLNRGCEFSDLALSYQEGFEAFVVAYTDFVKGLKDV